MAFKPSPQQRGLFDWVENSTGNAFVEAVAGSGKTTSLIEACIRMKGSVAFAAYNKKIADEIKDRIAEKNKQHDGLSNRVRAGTFHSFGFSAWRRVHPKVKVDVRTKTDMMIDQNFVEDNLREFVVKLVSLAKQSGAMLLWNVNDEKQWYDIVDRHDLDSDLENQDDTKRGIESAIKCIEWARKNGNQIIDFDDMIWLPAISNIRFYEHDWVLVDEAQDTNPVRRILARKMVRRSGRVVFVGDRHQAIYGFTGADNDAVELIIKDFGCKLLPLTVTYRCPKSIVANAQAYVSHIVAHETAPDGSVSSITDETFEKEMVKTKKLFPTDAILCRNTKPLVGLTFKLLRAGIACHIEGRDVGQGLVNLVKKYKTKKIDVLIEKLNDYADKQVKKLNAKGKESQAEALNDRVETIIAIAEGVQSVDELVAKIVSMFQDSDGQRVPTLTLSTVHKAKGREWDRVFIFEKNKHMPSKWARQKWQKEQENNLIYVAITRTKRELVYLN
jgi:DNA helicase II / ATP-dependent DNA helicase PcrA